jgi:glycosyltransferase involved in cell wall biosynthesis
VHPEPRPVEQGPQASQATGVTVAIPVYNGERFLAEALTSVLEQTTPPDELLVFDNCSTDRTVEIAETMAPGAVRRSAQNLGAVANFNRSVSESTGRYFAWLAADDRLQASFIERSREALEAAPEAAACLPAIQFIDVGGRALHRQQDPALRATDPSERFRSFLRRPRWTEVYCLYRRSALLTSPMFRDEWGADVILTWWFLLRGPLVVLDDPLLHYRVYPTKKVEEVANSLNPRALHQHWRMLGLWRSLWRETAAADVPRPIARAARRELLSCLVRRNWLKHLCWDAWILAQDLIGRGQRTLRARSRF